MMAFDGTCGCRFSFHHDSSTELCWTAPKPDTASKIFSLINRRICGTLFRAPRIRRDHPIFATSSSQPCCRLNRQDEQLRLFTLLARTHDGEYHRSICPAAYNERTGEHYPEEMARWRADFRALSPERQMMAATIVWMYRCGPDSIWLRRVPCAWKASEALHTMRDTGCLALWLQLVARYPGW